MILLCVVMFAGVSVISAGPICSPGPADVMFVLTSNSTLSKTTFNQKLRVVERFAESVKVGRDDVRIGLITEYDYPDLEFHMNDHLDKQELSLAILFTYFATEGIPSFGSGLEYINENGIDARLGGRPGVPDIVVFLTDGVPADSRLAQAQAKLLSDSGATVIAAAGGDSDELQLINLASGCHYVAQAPDFSSLDKLALPIVNLTCDAINGVSVDECECELIADIVFLLDASALQGKANYIVQKNFANALASELNIAPNESRIAAVTYADFTHPQFGFMAHPNGSDAAIALRFLPYQGDDGRNVEVGLDFINTNLSSQVMRGSAEKIIVLTSTAPLSNPDKAEAAALQLQDKGFTILSVGIDTAKQEEMKNLATNNDYAKYYKTFSALLAGAHPLANFLCKSLRSTMAPFVDNTCTGSVPCLNGGQCVVDMGLKVCQCPQGYTGSVCQNVAPTGAPVSTDTTLQYCITNACSNGGTCIVLGDMYECRCPYGFAGLTCSDEVSTTPVTLTQMPTTIKTTTTKAPTSASTAPTTSKTTQTPVTPNPNTGNCPAFNSTYWGCEKAEVIFMLEYGRTDTGSSIDHEGDFFKLLLDEYKVDSEHVRVGVVVYHDTVQEVIHLNDYVNDIPGLKARITQLNSQLKPSGTPDLAKALDFVRENSFAQARPGVPKVIVSVIHQMGRDQGAIIQAGEKVKNDCIRHFIQAIRGSSLNENTLKQIATEPRSPYFIEHRSFSGLEFLGYIYNLRCPSK